MLEKEKVRVAKVKKYKGQLKQTQQQHCSSGKSAARSSSSPRAAAAAGARVGVDAAAQHRASLAQHWRPRRPSWPGSPRGSPSLRRTASRRGAEGRAAGEARSTLRAVEADSGASASRCAICRRRMRRCPGRAAPAGAGPAAEFALARCGRARRRAGGGARASEFAARTRRCSSRRWHNCSRR